MAVVVIGHKAVTGRKKVFVLGQLFESHFSHCYELQDSLSPLMHFFYFHQLILWTQTDMTADDLDPTTAFTCNKFKMRT
jgi:hypothetical protein